MRSSTFIAAFASLASFTLAAGQQSGGDSTLRILSNNNNLVKKDNNLVSAPARSRHATRDHRAHARNLRNSASKPSSSLKKRQSSRCKASSSSRVADLGDGKQLVSEDSSSSSSGSSSNSTGTIEDQKTTTSSGGLGDLDLDSSSSFLKIGNIYAGFLPGKHELVKRLPMKQK